MLVLSLDTTSDTGSLALLRDDLLLEERTLSAPDGFGHILFAEIEALLARHSLTIRDIDLFAAAAGPGSFTGVRVGLTAIKGLAEACAKPAAAISNLQALAAMGLPPLIDARRGEVYSIRDGQETVAPPTPEFPVPTGPPPPLAAAIARLALTHGGSDPAALDANYVRRSDAELLWKDR